MSANAADDDQFESRGGRFATTHWSLVAAAARRGSADADDALEALCRLYWYPLYAYVRRRVADVHAAQDLTQDFFARVLEKNYVAQARSEKGRFRAFLLTAFKHFLANEHDKALAHKRGGDRAAWSLDLSAGESRYSVEPATNLTPERVFDRQWALGMIDLVLGQLRDEQVRAGKERQFDELKAFLAGRHAPGDYDRAALALGLSTNATQVAAHRLRSRYRELFRAEVARTVADPAEVDDEIRSLISALEP